MVAIDIDDIAVWRANEEPPYAPRFGGERIDNLKAASFRFLVRLLDVLADSDRYHRIEWRRCVARDELHDGLAVRGLEAGDPAQIQPFNAEP